MSALLTRIEREAVRSLTPLQIFDITARRLPGTFLGVWNPRPTSATAVECRETTL
jgi:hypothetical protein